MQPVYDVCVCVCVTCERVQCRIQGVTTRGEGVCGSSGATLYIYIYVLNIK